MHSTSGACKAYNLFLSFVLCALAEDASRATQQVLNLGFGGLGQRVQLTLHLAVYPAHAGAQCAHGFLHALELLGVRVAPNLGG